MKLTLKKLGNGILIPADPMSQEDFDKLKSGQYYTCAVTKQRNPQFHRKWFALVKFAFDHWPINCMDSYKNFEVFRKHVTVLAGFYDEALDIHGHLVLEAKSLRFDTMDEVEFEGLYDKTINVVLQHVLKNYTKDDLEQVLEDVLRFA